MVHGARGMVTEKLCKASLFWCHQFARCAGARSHASCCAHLSMVSSCKACRESCNQDCQQGNHFTDT
jgi:hypothetical protein